MGAIKYIPNLQRLIDDLGKLPEPVVKPSLIVITGLPGTGKTYFAKKLADKIPVVVIGSDILRKTLFPKPNYSQQESALLFQTIHRLIDYLLKNGISLILDATNLTEQSREPLYNIADRLGTKLILVWIEAPPEVVRKRLEMRQTGTAGSSDADWEVYEQMRPTAEKILRNHYMVDTSRDINPILKKIAKEVLTT